MTAQYDRLKNYLESPPVTIVPTFNTFGVWETEVIGGAQHDFRITTDNMNETTHDPRGLFPPSSEFEFYDCYHGVGYRVKPGFRRDLSMQLAYLIQGYDLYGKPRWAKQTGIAETPIANAKNSEIMVHNSDVWLSSDGVRIPHEMYTDHIINILNRNIERGSVKIKPAERIDGWDIHFGYKIKYRSKSHQYPASILRKLVHEALARGVFFNELAFVKPKKVYKQRGVKVFKIITE